MIRSARLHTALLLALACLPAHAAPRAFVASTGNDANAASGCTPALPCRSFQAAHGAVDAGGEIVALDTAGYGTVVISKPVSIIGNPGAIPSIAVSAGSGVRIETGGAVTLRNLNINGVGANVGVSMTAGTSLNIENCVISNFAANGVAVTGVSKVRVMNTLIRGNGLAGIEALTGTIAEVVNSQVLDNGFLGILASSGTITVADSVSSGNAWGAGSQGAGGFVSVIRSSLNHNANSGIEVYASGAVSYSQIQHNGQYGLLNSGGPLYSMGNNMVLGNGVGATSGVITALPGI